MEAPSSDRCMAFVKQHTELRAPALVPEILLHLAGPVMNLWTETGALLAAKESSLANLPPPYWAYAWPGGSALSRYLLDNPEECAGKRMLDFGSGSGLAAIAAAQCGAAYITAAEIDPLARGALTLNMRVNNVAIAIEPNDTIGRDGGWDTILVADMCYEQPLAGRLTEWLSTLAKRGARILLGDPGRSYMPQQSLTPLATYEVPTSRDLEDSDMRRTTVYAWLT